VTVSRTEDDTPVLSMIDTHCHLDDDAFDGDLERVLNESRDAGVAAWINVGFAPERWTASMHLSRRYPGMSHMLGVHPSHAQEWNDDVRDRLRTLLVDSRARAVGEIGLDFYRDNAPLAVQRQALVGQLALARELGLPVVIHLRDAEPALLDILTQERDLPPLLFHSFDGSARLTRFVLEHDANVGVGGLATRQKSASLREQLLEIPLRCMVLETDAPYLIPARQKTRRNTPSHVRTVAAFLAGHLQRPLAEIARQSTVNAEAFFGRLLTS
jgi:TatD DNase family protein